MTELRVLFVTAPEADADRIVGTLVEERLVACGNVLPGGRSTYVWKGMLCKDSEAVIFMETTAAALDETTTRLRALHPYEVPKIVVLAPSGVNDDYLAWALGSIRK
jgi:periplasmic divalent cation tolerance protein